MRNSIWSCSSCAVFLLSAFLARDVSATHVGREWNHVHRIPKALVTARAVLGRDGGGQVTENVCSTEYTECPASLSGGCCPSKYACAVDSCYATTAGITTACTRANWYACAPVNGKPGCCPLNYICDGPQGCLAAVGATPVDLHCPTNYFTCEAGDGCCRNGLACGPGASCYSTDPVTSTIVQTITTTSGKETVTTTRTTVTVSTPTIPTDYRETGAAAMFILTSVPKEPAATPSSSSEPSSGLSGGAIGGIIGGVVVLLIVVVVAAFLIIRRLKQVETIVENSKRGSSSGKKTRSQNQAQMEHYGRHLHSDMDDMSVDPLMVQPSVTSTEATSQRSHGHGRNHSHGYDSTARGRGGSLGYTPSPNLYSPAEADAETPSAAAAATAAASANSDSHHSRSRHASPDPYHSPPVGGHGGAAGYFDIPPSSRNTHSNNLPGAMQPARMRGNSEVSASSVGGGGAGGGNTGRRGYSYTHWRSMSNTSELSADGSEGGAGGSIVVAGGRGVVGGTTPVRTPGAAADGGARQGQLIPELAGSGGIVELSGAGGVEGGGRSRSDSAASGTGLGVNQGTGVGGGQPLASLDETVEMPGHMHGHYGPPI
ncbi:uncharacterized protein C8A04DRAFT_9748 [Dichotomopilus funicola]|uniref:Mid2 domain-containing protein n=1 Tax=Dichotomopilus funicola TaxID=1934379 RepID=A0AAN6V7W9_9PEZI|nr:hypothetical protein C8A04DRAFT_9748 [Dichotomopilus funicola]